MIESYCGLKAGWRKRTSVDDEGNPSYFPAAIAEPLEIAVTGKPGQRLIRDENGEESLSETTLLTASPVGLGDLVIIDGDERPCMAVTSVIGLGGREVYREIRLFWQKSASSRGRT